MNKKSTYILAAVLLILISGYFVKNQLKENEARRLMKLREILQFETTGINFIEIQTPQKIYSLSKQNNEWLVEKYPAIEGDINRLLQDLEEAVVVSIASKNQTNKNDFGLDEARAQKFTFKNNDQVMSSFVLGANDFNSGVLYAIKEGREDILAVKGLSSYFLESPWISMLVDKTEKSEISKVTIQEPKNLLILEKKGSDWRVNNYKGNQAKIEDFLNYVSKITAVSLSDKENLPAFDSKITITTSTSTAKVLELSSVKDDKFYIKNSRGLMYILNKETRDRLFKKAWELR